MRLVESSAYSARELSSLSFRINRRLRTPHASKHRHKDCSKTKEPPGIWDLGGGEGRQVGAGLSEGHLSFQVDGRTEALLSAHPASPTRPRSAKSPASLPSAGEAPGRRGLSPGSCAVGRLGGPVRALESRGVVVEHFRLTAAHPGGRELRVWNSTGRGMD